MKDIKSFNIKLPKEVWVFLKKKSAEDDMSMNAIIIKELVKLKQKCEKNV